MVVDNYTVIEDKIKRNEVLGDILWSIMFPLILSIRYPNFRETSLTFEKYATNKKYTLICNQDSLKTAKALYTSLTLSEYIVFRFEDTLWVDVCQRDVVIVEKSIAGEIRSNLSETIEELGISHDLTNRFVDVFRMAGRFSAASKRR